MPWEIDVMTVLRVSFREVDEIEIGTAVVPIQLQHRLLVHHVNAAMQPPS
jgi:hypothetical protein